MQSEQDAPEGFRLFHSKRLVKPRLGSGRVKSGISMGRDTHLQPH